MEEKKEEILFTKTNYKIIGGGFLLVIIGFILMAGGKSDDPNVFNPEIFSFRRITLSPILIIAGYIVIMWGIMKKTK
ncbi:MAG: DUF3098 domain-containing protein [Bacteroidetes bacterium]|nr:MAG: DUF3098 domain-containing protein [Bacteroidota bacterium]